MEIFPKTTAVDTDPGQWHTVYIGLGSNIEPRKSYLQEALRLLDNRLSKVIRVSKLYTTKPVGYAAQTDFLNGAAEIKTLLAAPELLHFLLAIETCLKRERTARWGPRTIDLDILLYDDAIINTAELTIPHPRMHERLFVLVPLAEIAPNIIHPVLHQSINSLKCELSRVQSL